MRRSNRLSVKRTNYPSDGSDEDQPKKSKSDKSNVIKKSKLTQKESNQPNSDANERLKILPPAKVNSKRKVPKKKSTKDEACNSSSSESDIENYLQPADEIDLNSTFFTKLEATKSFEAIENSIFSGINRLSDSESDSEFVEPNYLKVSKSKKIKKLPIINFQHVQDYTKKLEEAKKVVAKYEAKNKIKQETPEKNLNIETEDISNLLAVGEAKLNSSADSQPSLRSSDYESFSESEKEDWEEVEERDLKQSQENKLLPKNDLQITVELPTVMRQKKGKDLVASMKRRLNRIRKENQVFVHQVHVLCWIGHGNYVNKILNNESVLALFLSLIPTQYSYKTIQNLINLEEVLKWYKSTVSNIEKRLPKDMALDRLLKLQIIRKEVYNKKMLVYLYVCLLRSLGIQCRLVLSFQVSPLKPPASELHSLSTKSTERNDIKKEGKEEAEFDIISTENKIEIKIKSDVKIKKEIPAKQFDDVGIGKQIQIKSEMVDENKIAKKTSGGDSTFIKSEETVLSKIKVELNDSTEKENKGDGVGKKTKESKANNVKQKKSKANNQQSLKVKSEEVKPKTRSQSTKEEKSENKKSLQLNTKPTTRSKSTSQLDPEKSKALQSAPVKTRKSLSLKRSNNNNQSKIPQLDGVNDSDEEPTTSKKTKRNTKNQQSIKKHSKRVKSLPDYSEINSDDDFKPEHPKRSVQNKVKSNSVEETKTKRKSTAKNRKSQNQNDDDSDYTPEIAKKKKDDSDDEFDDNTKKNKQQNRSKKVADDPEPKPKKGFDIWVEVYLETEKQWISVDVVKGEVNCTRELYSRASHPITYVIAWNNDNSIKDITQRYCPKWNTLTRKLRVAQKWWDDTIKPFEGQKTARDQKEDEELAQSQLDKPLPTTIHEYKNHPLYVLKRHLLKFEALYPPEPVTLGFIRKEAVYSRDCVHRLRTREFWFKQAKVVKPGEDPYKIVKTIKWDKIRREMLKDQPLEIFGVWQVDNYVPPTAQNGIVPRNEYGNVELFQTCMLPKGTVHLQLPGLNKLARRMNIDCAPAMVGFDFHSGWNHPVFDGYVVCEEHSETLIAAWYLEQEEQEKREQEKLDKRVYGNWKKLIKGLLIRERLKARYDFGAPSQSETGSKKKKSKGPKFASKKRRHCNENESDSDCD